MYVQLNETMKSLTFHICTVSTFMSMIFMM